MQMEDTKEIPKRARYYQAMCDSPETENIDRLVKWYQTDNETRKCFANLANCNLLYGISVETGYV